MDLPEKGCIRAIIAGSSLTFILFLLQRTLPVIGPTIGFIVPFPCIFYSLKSGRKVGYAIVALLLIGLSFVATREALLYCLQSVAISLVIPELLLRGKELSNTLIYTVSVNTVLLFAFYIAYGNFFQGDLDTQMQGAIHSAVAEADKLYRSIGLTGADLQNLLLALHETEKIIISIYPSLILILVWLSAACNLWLVRKSFRYLGKDISVGSFPRFRNPDYLVWLLIAAGFSLLVDESYVTRITLNFLIVILFLYFIQGLAICVYFQRKLSLSKVLLPVFCALMFIQPIVMVPVAALGLFDLWADFRAPKQQENL